MFIAITDLITLSIFMCITPSVKEAAALLTRGDRRELATLQVFNSLYFKWNMVQNESS